MIMLLVDIGEATGMMAEDVIATLASLDMISERDSRFVTRHTHIIVIVSATKDN